MGLDIYFITDKEKTDKKAGEKHDIAYFRKFNALYAWIDRHVGEVENCEELLLDKDHFE